jgi:glycosyltransferase involved in cell wall biosynthesis
VKTLPLISCIVPSFNSAPYLREALEGIVAQTYRPLEVIVADDGSTDTTREIASSYGNLVCLVVQPTAGPAATRNLGLRAARGELVAFLDADDLWHAEKLARQYARFQAQPDLDLSVTAAQLFWTADLTEEEQHYHDNPRAQPLPGYATTTLLAKRAVFDRVGPFDATLWFADATEWFMRAAEHGARLELLPEVLTFHRMHPGNLTRRRSEASRQEFLRIVRASLYRQRARPQASSSPYRFPGLPES